MSACPNCPRAREYAGTPATGRIVVCEILEYEDKVADNILEGMFNGIEVTENGDPRTFYGFCHGEALPMVSKEQLAEPRGHYTYCPIWLDAWQARQDEKDRVYEMPEQPSYYGMDSGITDTLTGTDAARSIIEDFGE